MQTADSMCAWSEGRIRISSGAGTFYLAPVDIVTLLAYRKEVPLRLEHGDADVEASVFQHPHEQGFVISVLNNAWLVPRETIAALYRGEITECGMERIAYRGPL
jgi:hypothetical protein